MNKTTVLGIDFGSIYWTAYVCNDGQSTVVSDERGNRLYVCCLFLVDSLALMLASIFEIMKL